MEAAKWALKLFSFSFTNSCNSGRFLFFQNLVSVDVEISQVKRFNTFTNCYQDDSRQYVSSLTQFSVGYWTILFPLNFINIFHNIWFGKLELVEEETWMSFDLLYNILDRSEVDF